MKKNIFLLLFFPGLLYCTNLSSQDVILKATAPGYAFKGTVQKVNWQNSIQINSFTDGIEACIFRKNCPSTLPPIQVIMPLSLAVNDFRSVQILDKTIVTADLVVFSSGNVPFEIYRIRMEDIKVRGVQEGKSGDEPLTVKIELLPTRIAWRIRTQKPDGTFDEDSKFGWDFAKNIPFAPAGF